MGYSQPWRFSRGLLAGLPGTVCMMNDILVFGATQEEHDDHFRTVFKQIQESGMMLNADKCQFSQKRVKFLGHIVDSTGIHPDSAKIQGIMETTKYA